MTYPYLPGYPIAMGKIHCVQLLCRARHCILAAVYNSETKTLASTEERIRKALEAVGSPWRCGLCSDTDLFFDDQDTEFDDMDEATPWFARLQAQNLLTRAMIDQEKANRRN